VDGTGSGSCPVVGFDSSGAEPLSSATAVLDKTSVINNSHRHYLNSRNMEQSPSEANSRSAS